MRSEGSLRTAAGRPVPWAAVGTWDPRVERWVPRTLSRQRGEYTLDTRGPALLSTTPWPSAPGAICAAVSGDIPEIKDVEHSVLVVRGRDFVVPETCAFQITLDSPSSSARFFVARPSPIVVGSHTTGVVEARIAQGGASLDLPCDVTGIAANVGASLFGGADGGLAPLPRGGGSAALTPLPTRIVQVAADDPGRFSVHDPLGWRGVPPGGSVPVLEGATLTLRAPGLLPSVLDTRHGAVRDARWSPDSHTLTPTAPASRRVVATCTGAPDGRCPAPPSCASRDGSSPTPCALWADGTARCDCPEGEARVSLGARHTDVPPEGAEVVVDVSGLGTTIAVEGPPGCVAQARRDPDRWTWWGPEASIDTLSAPCDDQGRVVLGPTSTGSWTVRVGITEPSVERRVSVGDTPIELGKITHP